MMPLRQNVKCGVFIRMCITYILKRVISNRKTQFFLCSFVLCLFYYFGVFCHLFENNYYNSFSYPLHGDITKYVKQLRKNETPDHEPINSYNYSFIINPVHKCLDNGAPMSLRLVYIVKSAAENFERRLIIRNTWGFENRFSDVSVRTLFILGTHVGEHKLQREILQESSKYVDIIQSNFIDSYFNNTIKTMMGFKWATLYCPNSKFYFFCDDDMYVSTKNVLRFVRNPVNYPSYLETPVVALKPELSREKIKSNFLHSDKESFPKRYLKQVLDFELADNVELFAGYLFLTSPHRHFNGKWYVSLEEYPYHMWPPYLTAGAYVVSREALHQIYYASFFTKHFRFDDIYLGLIAKKINIEPLHNSEFYFYKKAYTVSNYRYVVASHGYDDPNELMKVWNEQKSAGNA